jgi:hypothetical protein
MLQNQSQQANSDTKLLEHNIKLVIRLVWINNELSHGLMLNVLESINSICKWHGIPQRFVHIQYANLYSVTFLLRCFLDC